MVRFAVMAGHCAGPPGSRSWTLLRGVAGADPMLSTRRLLDHGGVTLTDVTCRLPTGRGHPDEAGHLAIVFVRSGCFVRTADATSNFLDPTQAYCINPGQEQRYDHPHAGGDDCTSVRLEPAPPASFWGG